MQKAYLTALFELIEKDKDVVLLLADSGTAYDELLKKNFPDRVLDFGIAEENMVLSAAGMASCGKIPFVFTASAFLSYRSMEFIRDDVCFLNHNVKIIGMGAGLGWSTLGPTHHTTEELSVLRSLPNLTVFSPSCPSETALAVKEAYNIKGPVYIRIGMGGEQELYQAEFPTDIYRNNNLTEGKDVAIFFTGTIGLEVLKSAKQLEEQGLSVQVTDICSICPLDKENIIKTLRSIKNIVTVEEHNITGGIGSAVAEIIAEQAIPVNFLRIGLNNCFAKGYGTQEEVRAQNGLDAKSITEKVFSFYKHH